MKESENAFTILHELAFFTINQGKFIIKIRLIQWINFNKKWTTRLIGVYGIWNPRIGFQTS